MKSVEEPPVKKAKKNPDPAPKKILSAKKVSSALKETGKIVETAWKGTWPFVFIEFKLINYYLIDCCELKNAILLSPGSFAIPCFVRKCTGGNILQLRDLSVLKAGKLSDVSRKKEIAEMLADVQNDDFSKFAITEHTAHTCGAYFTSEVFRLVGFIFLIFYFSGNT